MDIKVAWEKLITQTGNPLAPMILQEAHGSADRLGEMLAGCCDRSWVEGFADRLTLGFTEAELEKACSNPAFIMALAGMLSASLVRYGKELGELGE